MLSSGNLKTSIANGYGLRDSARTFADSLGGYNYKFQVNFS
jgi:hypothetical protein